MEPKVERYYLMIGHSVINQDNSATRWSYPPGELVEAKSHRYWWAAVDQVTEGIPDKATEIEFIGGLESVEGVRSHLQFRGFTNVTSAVEKRLRGAETSEGQLERVADSLARL